MKHYFIKFALLIASTCAFGAGAQAQEKVKAETGKMPMVLKVELLVYSGRPNPTFLITDQKEIREIMGLANSLPHKQDLKQGESAMPHPKLGYQGFIVTNATAISPEIKSFAVNGSAVQLSLAPAATSAMAGGQGALTHAAKVDAGNSLESKLLSQVTSQGIVDEKTLEFIENSK
jgi:hypothetical protein